MRSLALIHDHVDVRLPVRDGGVGAALAAGDGRVALDQGRHLLAFEFDAEGEWSHVEEKQVRGGARDQVCATTKTTSGEDTALDSCPDGNGLVWVYGLAEIQTSLEEVPQGVLQGENPRGTTDQDTIAHVVEGKPGVFQDRLDRVHAPVEEGLVQSIKGLPSEGQGHINVLRQALHLDGGGRG
mmetsp:Transcript_16153/g.47433  ORF Transcript_16153/g.47433 Transcript_16153/m.47433 type:complete len:183 (+) Transcript_16153:582-1130(+)